MLATVMSGEDDLGPEVNTKIPSLTLAPGGDHLSPSQLTDVARLQTEFADVFSPLPGRTNLIQHHIETEPGVVMRSRPYRLPEHKKKVVESELEAMLEMGVIEESHSDWASPIVLVPKTDGSVRFCVDYRKVNAVSKFEAYPMPRVDELLDRLGTARIYSTLDLTKGYWQIPLSPLSKEKTAFTTPFVLHQFVTLPFGLFGVPATFQRLMDKIMTKSHGPLLHSPDFSLPFLLQTDTLDRGLGAVLTQEIGGEERPVLYIYRKREMMYSTIEKECLAIRWTVLTLRYYLL